MIWDNITILNPVKVDTDELGNDKFIFRPGETIKARKNAPKDLPISLDNREVTQKEHLFYLPKNQSVPPAIKFMEHKGQIYKVLSVEALTPRFVQLKVVTYENRSYRR